MTKLPDASDIENLIKQANADFDSLSRAEQAEQRHQQRISWVFGQLKLAGRTVTKEQITIIEGKMSLDLQRENALLKATLREILRIEAVAANDSQYVSFDDALEGRVLRDWLCIMQRAKSLLAQTP